MAAILDSVVRDPDALILNVETSGPRDAEQLLGCLGREEDNLGGCRVMSVEVGVVDVCAPDAADVANALEKLTDARSRREIGEPESAVLVGGEMLGTGVGLSVHAVVARRELGRAGSAGDVIGREGSRGSLLHHSLHGQEASSRGVDGHLSRMNGTSSRASNRASSRMSSRANSGGKLVDGGNSRRRQAKNVNSKRSIDSGFDASRAEERALKLREIKRGVGHVGSTRHLAIHGSDSSIVSVAGSRMLLRIHGVTRRLTGEALRVGWADHVGGRVGSGREASLVGRKGRRTRDAILTANEAIPLVHVGVQRAPASVSSSRRLSVRSSSDALVEMGRRPDLHRLVAETRKASDEARHLTARNLAATNARGSVANLVDGRERAGGEMGEGAEDRSGSSSRDRRNLSPCGGNRLPEEGSSVVWSAGGLGITLGALRGRARERGFGSIVDEVAHLGLLVVALTVHGNEGRGGRRGFLQNEE